MESFRNEVSAPPRFQFPESRIKRAPRHFADEHLDRAVVLINDKTVSPAATACAMWATAIIPSADAQLRLAWP